MIAVDLCRYLRFTFIHLIPCVLLVGLNARLFVAMRRAHAHHRRLLRENLLSESHRLADTNMATLMLLVVVGVFLLVEVPLVVMMMMMIVENTFSPQLLMDPDARRTALLIINLIIVFSYPVNFFIYCGMSQQFRETFCRLLVSRTVTSVLPAPTQPTACADVVNEGNGDDGRDINVDKNDDVEAINMTEIK